MNDLTVTVTDLYNNNQLNFVYGRYNIIDCGIRTGKTYWAVNNLVKYTRDNKLFRILFLTDTLALKNSILQDYSDKCCDADELWKTNPNEWSSENINKIGIMCYQSLGMLAMRENLEFLENIDVICWDECDAVFDFAAAAFARARKVDFARKDSTNEEILNLIQQHSTKKEYMPLVLLGAWERIVNAQRILCVGLSASPERAKMFYASLTNASNKGKLDAGFRAAKDIYFHNILEHIDTLVPIPDVGYWCFSPSIVNNRSIVAKANAKGFKAIEIHSRNNADAPLDEEQLRVIQSIELMHMVPLPYNFVVVTRAFERGLDILDTRFRNLIIDSYYQVDRIQAGRQTFPYQRHVKVLTEAIPDKYKNKWLSLQECRELADYMSIPDIDFKSNNQSKNQSKIMAWNKLQDILPAFGYTVTKGRKRLKKGENATTAYFITGDWKDAEIVSDNEFMQLVAAKSATELLE